MSKKIIVFLCMSILALVFSLVNHIFNSLNVGIWYEIIVAGVLTIIWVISSNFIYKKYKISGYGEVIDLVVKYYPIEDVTDHVLEYAVIMAKYNGKWIFVRHEERNTWEIPGGRRELNEDIVKTAERELIEETGAKRFELKPVCVYSVSRDLEKSYGLLCYAEIFEFGNPLELEICEIKEFEELPKDLTYPLIQPELFNKVTDYLEIKVGLKSFT